MLTTIFSVYCVTAFGAGNVLFENVLVSRSGDTTTVEVRFGCPTRYIDHFPLFETDRLQINLSRLDQCGAGVFGSPVREIRIPAGRAMARIDEVEYVAKAGTESLLLIRFDRPVRFSVRQRGGLRSLQLLIETPTTSDAAETKAASTLEPEKPLILPVPVPDTNTIDRSLERLRRAEEAAAAQMARTKTQPPAQGLFAINLESTTDPISAESIASAESMAKQQVYLTDIILSGQSWYRLRSGFFSAESAAQAAAKTLRSRFPDAWVVKVSEQERDNAGKHLVSVAEDLAPASAELIEPAIRATASNQAPVTQPDSRRLSEAQIAELMAEAETELQKGNFSRAVQIYTKILNEPEHSLSADAREYLGLARERNNQIAHAVAEYRKYLDLYPEGEGAERVGQRLAGLLTARKTPKASQRSPSNRSRQSPWETYGGIAQYYRRDVFDTDSTGEVVAQSSMLTDADVMVRRRGNRFDFSSRITIGHLYDFLSEDEGPGNNSRFYNAYVDLQDGELDLFTRVGRQSLHTSGVLGRFDGLQVGYDWKPDIRFNVITGYPVDSSADSIQTERFFYGTGVDFSQLYDLFDISIFYNRQEVSGLENRQAIGAELRYYDISRSLISALDYDIGFNTLNSFVALGNWTFNNRMTLTATVDIRKSPYLTTRTALIGQQVTTIEDLLLSFSEADIRQLAEDRAADVQTYSFGLSKHLFERFQVNLDVTMTQFGGTPASGGVPEMPDFGTQLYYSANFIGYSLFKEGDSSIFGMRYIDSDTSTTSTLSFDSRHPLSNKFRINPRIIVSMRESTINEADRWLARPSLRFLYRLGRHYQLDFEFGGEWSSTDSSVQTIDTSSYFLYLGYRADF